jgi:pimeloyl-ACP methyl ester carboxylesterase
MQGDRRAFLQVLATGAAAFALPQRSFSQEKPVDKKTFTYKTVEQCEIKADVYANDADKTRPAVIWIHGGALIMGHRGQIDQALLGKLLKAGYAVVSIDYRLAPETKLPAILEDLQDAYRWVREKGPELFQIDAQRIAVMGGSAGGYLTLSAGFRANPRPTALVSFWGYGDIAGPDPHARHCGSGAEQQVVGVPAKPAPSGPRIVGFGHYSFIVIHADRYDVWTKPRATASTAQAGDPLQAVRGGITAIARDERISYRDDTASLSASCRAMPFVAPKSSFPA